MAFGVSDSRFRVPGLRSRVSGFGSRISGSGLWIWGLGSRISVSGFRVPGLGFQISGFGLRAQGFGSQVWGFGSQVSGSGFRVQGSVPRFVAVLLIAPRFVSEELYKSTSLISKDFGSRKTLSSWSAGMLGTFVTHVRTHCPKHLCSEEIRT